MKRVFPALPTSATSTGQVLVGLACLLLGCWAVFGLHLFGDLGSATAPPLAAAWATAFLVLLLGAGMTANELAGRRDPQRSLMPAAAPWWRRAALARLLRKWLGLHMVLAACALVFWVLQEYQGALYQPFFGLCRAVLPVFSLLSLPYIAWVDARMAWPHDAYWQLGEAMLKLRLPAAHNAGGGATGQPNKPLEPTAWKTFALGWGVKAFFLPLMLGYAVRNVQGLAAMPTLGAGTPLRLWFELAITLLYFADVVWGAVGYLWSLRLTDSHIRSAEPTTLGWLVALVCYEPFSRSVFPAYFAYGGGPAWGHWFADQPLWFALWGSVIVALTAVYTAATMAFGLRFSNLTHRGIITSGPYRWCRHPAYLCKNLSWWLISMPFMVHTHWSDSLRLSLMLAAVNAVYWLRARTEERHLAQDPVYQAYAAAMLARRRLALQWLLLHIGQPISARANWGRLPAPHSSPAP